MSPTSYQTAPPRALIITTVPRRVKLALAKMLAVNPTFATVQRRKTSPVQRTRASFRSSHSDLHPRSFFPCPTASAIDFVPFTFRHDFRGIDRLFIHLLFQDLSVFSDQEVHTPRRFVFVSVDTVLVSDLASPIAQQREADADLLGECPVRKRTIHTHTQDLGVDRFQLLKVLLEVFHLLCSTPGECKNIKRQYDVLLSAVVAQMNVLQILPVEVLQLEVRRSLSDAKLHIFRPGGLRPARPRNRPSQKHSKQNCTETFHPSCFLHLLLLITTQTISGNRYNSPQQFFVFSIALTHK